MTDEAFSRILEEKLRPISEELEALRTAVSGLAAPSTESLLSVAEVATRSGGVTTETVRAWIHDGKLEARKVQGRWLVGSAELGRFLGRANGFSSSLPQTSAATLPRCPPEH